MTPLKNLTYINVLLQNKSIFLYVVHGDSSRQVVQNTAVAFKDFRSLRYNLFHKKGSHSILESHIL